MPKGHATSQKFLEALEQLGWLHGRNVQTDYRWAGADRDRFQRYATELVALKPDLIVGQSTPAVAALLRVTRAIPIVFVNVSDPVGSGFIESLAHPGGNITGFSNFEPAMGGKWVGLLKDIAPHVARIELMSGSEVGRIALKGLAFLSELATPVTRVATYVPDLSLLITPRARALRSAARV